MFQRPGRPAAPSPVGWRHASAGALSAAAGPGFDRTADRGWSEPDRLRRRLREQQTRQLINPSYEEGSDEPLEPGTTLDAGRSVRVPPHPSADALPVAASALWPIGDPRWPSPAVRTRRSPCMACYSGGERDGRVGATPTAARAGQLTAKRPPDVSAELLESLGAPRIDGLAAHVPVERDGRACVAQLVSDLSGAQSAGVEN